MPKVDIQYHWTICAYINLLLITMLKQYVLPNQASILPPLHKCVLILSFIRERENDMDCICIHF